MNKIDYDKSKTDVVELIKSIITSPLGERLKTITKAKNIIENNKGQLSDGHHSFNELYHHRALLFATICNTNKDIAWKSKKHYDGTMFDDMFIVGILTPEGQATYHYDIDPYWKAFDVKELPRAPKFDGHTPDVAIQRIFNMGNQKEKEKEK